MNCLDETKILVDSIRYLSLYYLVNELVQLPNPHINAINETQQNHPSSAALDERAYGVVNPSLSHTHNKMHVHKNHVDGREKRNKPDSS